MTEKPSQLLKDFLDWAEKTKLRCKEGVTVKIELGPPYDKQCAFASFDDDVSGALVSVWDSGEIERQAYHIDTEDLLLWAYEENIDSLQIEDFAQPVIAGYLNPI
jgi:hypothetical protein